MMKGEAGLLIQELRQACRQSLFNGISDVTNSFVGVGTNIDSLEETGCSEKVKYTESETGSTTSSQKFVTSHKRLRSEEILLSSDPPTQARSWDSVCAIHPIITTGPWCP